MGAIFDLHSSTLYAIGKSLEVACLNVSYVVLLWLSSWIAIPIFGLWGYGIAEVVALLSYALVHYSVVKFCGPPNYSNTFWIVLTLLPSLLAGVWLPPILSFGLLIVSYGVLFVLNSNVRGLPVELWSVMRRKSA